MAEGPTTNNVTDNHGLQLWKILDPADENWQHRSEMEYLDEGLPVFDAEANRSNYTAYSNSLYVSTDSPYNVYLGNGTSWDLIGQLSVAVENPLTEDLDAGGNSVTNAQSVQATSSMSIGGDDVVSSSSGDYDVQKNGTDGSGVVNFKTE